MPAKPKAEIDPARLYKIKFSKVITTYGGTKFIPRIGTTVRVRGRVLEEIKDQVDSYEVI